MLKNSRILIATATMVLMGAAIVSATPVLITNSGFEADALPDDGWTTNTITGWVCVGGSCGAYNPSTTQFSPDNPLAAPAGGVNVAYSNGGTITQLTGATVQAGGTYTLTAAVGNRLDTAFPGYLVELFTPLGTLASSNSPSPASGTFLTSTAVYTAPISDVQIGQAISIRLSSIGVQTVFDNVSLDAALGEAVPEPGTWSMLLIGFGAVAAGIRRKIRA
jgi:hypothetical protein